MSWYTSLEINQPVINFAESDVTRLKASIVEGTGVPEAGDRVSGLILPVDSLVATIIERYEFVRLQRALGENALDSARIEQLTVNLREVIPDSPVSAKTRPAKIRKAGSGRSSHKNDAVGRPHMLTIAQSDEVIKRRVIAKRAICEFAGVELEQIPEEIWLKDEKAASVVFALASDAEEAVLLEILKTAIIEDQGSSIPSVTTFGRTNVREKLGSSRKAYV